MKKFTLCLATLAVILFGAARLSAQTYFHDEVGRLIQVSYPNGQGIRYDYDEADNLISVQPLILPNAPTNLLVNRLSATSVELTWTDNSDNETGFVIERRAFGGSVWTQIAVVASNSQQYTDDTVVAGLDYDYRLSAQGTEGLSAYSNTQSTVVATLMISSTHLRNTTQGFRIELVFATVPGAVYRIETTAELAAPAWQSATFSVSLDGTANAQTITGTGDPQSVYLDVTASSTFFRLRRD